MPEELHQKPVTELVSENYVFASILYYFDIRFFDYSEETLEEVCIKKGLDVDQVISELEKGKLAADQPEFSSYPVDVIIEYLKHSHFIFAKRKMPYLAILIEALDCEGTPYENIAKDLKFIFPIFIEDFIHHIYQEEDKFFKYILELNNALQGKFSIGSLYYQMEHQNISGFAAEHDAHDDTMGGIRKITSGYGIDEETPLHVRVIYAELKSFEKELCIHARIENDILFPKSLQLESQVKSLLKEKVPFN